MIIVIIEEVIFRISLVVELIQSSITETPLYFYIFLEHFSKIYTYYTHKTSIRNQKFFLHVVPRKIIGDGNLPISVSILS